MITTNNYMFFNIDKFEYKNDFFLVDLKNNELDIEFIKIRILLNKITDFLPMFIQVYLIEE
mgnify:CR=1 FL=1